MKAALAPAIAAWAPTSTAAQPAPSEPLPRAAGLAATIAPSSRNRRVRAQQAERDRARAGQSGRGSKAAAAREGRARQAAAPVDALPVDTQPVEVSPVEQSPVEQSSVEVLPVEVSPVEQSPVEQSPVEQSPVDELPVEQLPADALPVDAAPVPATRIDVVPIAAALIDAPPIDVVPVDAVPIDPPGATTGPGFGATSDSAPRRSATVLVPPVPPGQVEWSPSPDRPAGGRHGRLLVALLAIVPVCLVAIFLWRSRSDDPVAKAGTTTAAARSTKAAVARARPSSTGASAAPASLDAASTRAASSWIQNNLASSVTVAADPTTAAQLRNDGMDHVTALPATADQLRFVRYLVTAAAAEPASAPPASLRARATPIATFGRPGHTVTIEQVVALSSGETLPQLLARDRRARSLAGTQLAQNARLHTTAVTGPALRSGVLDLRAATVLAVLAGNGSVQLDRIDQIAAERTAHLPARTITITVPNAGAVGTQIRALAAPYGADSSQLSPTKLTVQWPVDVAPALPVQ